MIDWLRRAFGFEKQTAYMASEASVAHAQLSFGNGMIMLGSVDNTSAVSQRMFQPDEINGRETKNTNLIVSDCTPSTPPPKQPAPKWSLGRCPYGGKSFTWRDPEGHLWSIGEYDRPYGQSMRNRLRMN
jgi:uncharacterized glyoxalase superfamily protein PhnB